MKTITHKIIIKNCVVLLILLIQSFAFAQIETRRLDTAQESVISSSILDPTLATTAFSECSANDFTVNNFYLADINGNPLPNTCTPGTPQTAYIFALFSANTAAGRYSLYIDYDIYVNGVFSSHVNDCLYQNQAIPVGQNLQVQQVSWNCGDRIEFRNFYMAWQTNINKPCDTNPSKCYFSPPGFLINAPLIANFTNAFACDSYLVNFTNTTTGGNILNPYTYKWDINNDGTVEYTTANPSHTFPGPGTYQVKLTVTDFDGIMDTQIYSVIVNPILQGLILTPSNVSCNGNNNGEILASGVTGGFGNYTYSISPQPTGYVQNGAQFSNLTSGTYTVTVTDERNCSISRDITLSIDDNTNPILTAPSNILVDGCTVADITNGNLTALMYSNTPLVISASQFTAEGGTYTEANVNTITYQDSQSGTCPITVTRTFTITDACGNSATAAQTINIQDITAPVIDALPVTSTIDCPATPVFAQATANDACSDVTLTFEDVTTPGTCENTFSVTRTWTATDVCGNASMASQTINVQDVTAPVIDTLPTASTIDCSETVVFAQATANDACGDVTLTFEDVTTPGSCENTFSVTRTWTATDVCGNASMASQIINVQDVTAPVIDTLPTASTIDCSETVVFAQATANDACSDVTLTFEDVTTPGSCENTFSVTRTWTATDACGNASMASQTINVQDVTAPVIDTLPTASTIDCSETVVFAQATANDACSDVTLTFEDVTTPGSCENTFSVTRTWTATDACGNASMASQTINVQDVTAPVIDTLPTASTIDCSETVVFAQATANDACSDVTLTFEDVTTLGSCENTFSVTRTWTATDACGNATMASQTINVQDVTAPVINTPATNVVVECDGNGNNGAIENWLNSNGGAIATDACSTNLTWTNNYDGATSDCSQPVTVTFTVTDDCGNSSSTIGTYTIQDSNPPTVTPASPMIVDCDGTGNTVDLQTWLNSNGGATATDDCSSITWSNNFTGLSDGCGATGAATVTFMATDGCGNSASTTATFTIIDVDSPPITNAAQDLTVECDGNGNLSDLQAWLDSNAGATAFDNCSEITWSNNYNALTNTCGSTGSVTVLFTVTDECGLSSSSAAVFTIVDNTSPVFVEILPTDITVECDAVPTAETLTATDNCGTANVTFSEVRNDGDCPSNYTLVRTWTATDACGLTTEHTQTVTVQDTTAPSFVETLPADITAECDNVPDASAATLTATDNCGTANITFSEIRNDGNCPSNYILVRTWTATDACGLTTEHTQTVTVQDTTAPSFVEALPTDAVVECDAVPTASTLTATDNCGTANVNFSETRADGDCPSNYTLIRTWTATDTCGLTTEHTQTVTVQDTTAPSFVETLPADITAECDDVPDASAATLTATDNCGTANVTFSEIRTDGDCPSNYILVRTWTATDACGLTTEHTQTVTVQDTTAPTFVETLPADITVECDNVPDASAATLTAIDNCGTADVTFSEIRNDGNCPSTYSLVRTWTATDACGLTTEHTQTITVQDTIAPAIDIEATSIVVECDGNGNNGAIEAWLNNNGGATATDNCSTNLTWTNNYNGATSDCSAPVEVIFTVTDECGNSASTTATYSIQDVVAPVITEATDLTVECDGSGNLVDLQTWLGGFAGATASDDCSSVTWSNDFNGLSDNCGLTGSATVTFTATDGCGNSSSTTAVFTIIDTTAPIIDALPLETTIDCSLPVEFAQANASDECSGDEVTLTFEDATTAGACEGSYAVTRTWTATDACGNVSTASQTINVQDITAPVIDALPADVTIDCADADTLEFAQATATDACGSEVTLTFEDATTAGPCEGSYAVTRTWTATDACGNASTATQTINVQDITAPVIDALPTDVTIDCANADTLEFAQATATDACGSEVTLTFEDATTAGACEGSYAVTRTWTATDACGNASTATQTINVQDITAPVFDALPAEATIECTETPDFAQATATDACGSEVNLTFEDVTTSGACDGDYSITRTWTATDACGNSSTATQTINVQDNTAPNLVTELETDITIDCSNIPEVPNLVFEDACSDDIEVIFNETSTATGGVQNYVITRTWTVTDACANQATFTQTINVNVENQITATDGSICIEDLAIDLFDYLSGNFDTTGTWTVVSGNTSLNGSIFDPATLYNADGTFDEAVLGDYVFEYTITDGACPSVTQVTINVHDDCVVLPCGAEDVIISKAVTTYVDQKNDFFTVTGVETCGFIVELQIFNRWGALIYESKDYQGDWNGQSSKASIGGSNFVPTGTYYYVVNLKNSGLKPFAGPIYVATK